MAGAPMLPSRVRARPITPRRLTDLAAAAVLSCLAFVGLFPYLYMLETAVKSDSQFNSNEATPTWPLHFGNFATAWREVAPYLLSSIIVAACVMFGCVLLGSVSGFVLARCCTNSIKLCSLARCVASVNRPRNSSYLSQTR